jgi:DNA polymerase III subunit epsilon
VRLRSGHAVTGRRPARSIPPAPPRGDRRVQWRDASFAALDFETTGLDLRRDAIVSFGLIPVRDGRVDASGAVYREVAPDVPLSHSSIRIHELRPIDLAAAPSMAEVAGELREGLAGRFLLTWAGTIELHFLRRTFGGSLAWWRRRTIDVLRLAERGAADRAEGSTRSARRTLQATARAAGIPVERPHDALDDAFTTAQLFLVLTTRLWPDRGPAVRTLLRAGRL